MSARVGAPRIRRARLGERAALDALVMRAKAVWGYDDEYLALCAKALALPAPAFALGRVHVAERDGRAVGVLSVEPVGTSLDVSRLFVEPAAIGTGVGAALWRHAAALARRAGRVRLVVVSDPHAEGFYRRVGARRIGRIPSEIDRARLMPRLAQAV